MQDIRFLDADGDYLILEAADGVKFRLTLDETLRKAIRHDPTMRIDSSSISPRDIQNEVRNGITVEEIAARTGAPVSYIEKFAAPVLDELKHIVASALSVRITIAGDRYNESNQVEFGEIIRARLQSSGASVATWSCKRTDSDGWLITCAFEMNGSPLQAVWNFVPRRLALSPENENAVSLSSQNSLTEVPVQKLRDLSAAEPAEPAKAKPVASPVEVAQPEVSQPVNLTANLGDTLEFDVVIPFGRSSSISSASNVDAQAQFASDDEQPLSETADLLEALRQKRATRESDFSTNDDQAGVEPLHSISYLEAEVLEQELVIELEATSENSAAEAESLEHTGTGFTEEVEPVNQKPTASYKKGRPSIPSWDEIVFGSNKSDD